MLVDPRRVLVVLATELDFLQKGLLTQSLTGQQWLACLGLALVLPIVVEVDKWIRRRQQPAPAPLDPAGVVNPGRAVAVAVASGSATIPARSERPAERLLGLVADPPGDGEDRQLRRRQEVGGEVHAPRREVPDG